MIGLSSSKIPSRKSVGAVFSVAAFLVYSWTMYVSFRSLPSWLLFLNFAEICSIYAYGFLVDFMESIMLLLFATVVSLALPRGWWMEKFVPKSVVLVVVMVVSAQIHIHVYRSPDVQKMLLDSQLVWWLVSLLIAIMLFWWVDVSVEFSQILIDIADRVGVFVYIYLPLTIASFFVVVLRIL